MKQVNFIGLNKIYQVELSSFNKHSSFFSNLNLEEESSINLPLFDQFDSLDIHCEESVNEFFKYFRDQSIELRANNVISIQALSMKYSVQQLYENTVRFIEQHYQKVIEYFFSTNKCTSSIYEDLISKHFEEYSNDDRLFSLSISTLYRIHQRYLMITKKGENKSCSRVNIDFLIKTAARFKNESFIFISKNKFNREEIIYLKERMINSEEESGLEKFVEHAQHNGSFIVEYNKNETREREEAIKKMIENNKRDDRKYEEEIKNLKEMINTNLKRIEEEVSLLFCNYEFPKPIKLGTSATKISRRQFDGFPIREIALPNNIKSIEEEAFNECIYLTSVFLPPAVTAIGSRAFNGCKSLKEITIPPTVTSIGENIFSGCKEIVLSENMKSIPDNLFNGCSTLTKIIIPPTVTAIGSRAFNGCSSLKEITIPPTVTSIGENIFSGCKEIVLSENMKSIPDNLFNGCSTLTKIIISPTITTIGSRAFNGCSSLKEITIPPTVKMIGVKCFEKCANLCKITIDPSKTKIEEETFEGSSFQELIIPTNRTKDKISQKENVIFQHTNIDEEFFSEQDFNVQKDIMNIIHHMKHNDSKAEIERLCNFISLVNKEIILSKNQSKYKKYIVINNQHFYIKWNMTEILYSNGTLNKRKFYSEMKGVFFEIQYPTSHFKTIYDTLKHNNIKQINVFISDVQQIGDYAFSGWSSLTQITIPSSVTHIGKSAFGGCSSLTQITIPSSVTHIGDYAFCECSSLKQITIPSSVTHIGNEAFRACSSLTQITIPSSLTEIRFAFYECFKLNKILIVPCKEKRINYFENKFLISKSRPESDNYDTFLWTNQMVKSIAIPPFVKNIIDYAFSDYLSLTRITIPSSVTHIGKCAFSRCSSLRQIAFTIPSSVTVIGGSAFSECSSLTEITIPSSVTSIESSTFYGCSSLKQITIPSSVTEIGYEAFFNCKSLVQITFILPSSLTHIKRSAFLGCSSLTQISIPSSVTEIENFAFCDCSSLTHATIPSSLTYLGRDSFYNCPRLNIHNV